MTIVERGSADCLVYGGGKFEFGERETDQRRPTVSSPRTSIGILSYKPCQDLLLKSPYSPHNRVPVPGYDISRHVLQDRRRQCHRKDRVVIP